MGLKKGAKNKDIPEKILSCPKNIVSAFLRGYFDGDGCASKRGGIHCDSVSEKLIKQLHLLLLNFEIVATKSVQYIKPTKKVKVSSICYRLEMNGYNAYLFFEQIGFMLSRKQHRKQHLGEKARQGSGEVVPISSTFLQDYAKGMNMGWLKRQQGLSYRKIRELLHKKPSDYLEQILKDNFYWDQVKNVQNLDKMDFHAHIAHSFFGNGIICQDSGIVV